MTRRQLLRLLAAAPALAVTGCTAQSASSQQEKPLILRYAENQPEDYPTSKAAKAFAELVAQRTGGRVKVLVYSGAELGAEQSVIQQMQFGGVDFSRVSLSQLAEYEPELSVLQLPYLYSDAQQMWRVLDGSIGDEFLAMLDAGQDVESLFETPSEYLVAVNYITNVYLTPEGHPDKILLLAGSYHGPSVQAEYEFWVKAPGEREYSRVSAYSTRSWTEYAAAEHGTYQFRVNARIVGSSADFERYYECSVDF